MTDVLIDGHWLLRVGPVASPTLQIWSGLGDRVFLGSFWVGVTNPVHGNPIVAISAADVQQGAPDRRLNIRVSAANTVLRSALLSDLGPLPITIHWMVSKDGGETYTRVSTFVGRLSSTSLDADNIWTGQVETYTGNIDAQRPLHWSHESYSARYPGNRSLEDMRAIATGIPETRFPT